MIQKSLERRSRLGMLQYGINYSVTSFLEKWWCLPSLQIRRHLPFNLTWCPRSKPPASRIVGPEQWVSRATALLDWFKSRSSSLRQRQRNAITSLLGYYRTFKELKLSFSPALFHQNPSFVQTAVLHQTKCPPPPKFWGLRAARGPC